MDVMPVTLVIIVKRNSGRPEPPLPPSKAVQNFREGNAVDPRLETRVTTEPLDVAEYVTEDLLNRVCGIIGIAEHTVGDVEHGGVIHPNEFVVCRVLVGLKARHKQRLLTVQDATSFNLVKSYLSPHTHQLSG